MSEELAEVYANTKVTIWLPSGKLSATRATSEEGTDPGLRAASLDAEELFVITAWNPESVELTAEENSIANQELFAELQECGCTILEARGSSVDETWFEDSFAVLARSAAIAEELEVQIHNLAIKYRQNAYFKIKANTIEIVGALYSDLRISMPLEVKWSSASGGAL